MAHLNSNDELLKRLLMRDLPIKSTIWDYSTGLLVITQTWPRSHQQMSFKSALLNQNRSKELGLANYKRFGQLALRQYIKNESTRYHKWTRKTSYNSLISFQAKQDLLLIQGVSNLMLITKPKLEASQRVHPNKRNKSQIKHAPIILLHK